MSYEYVVTSCTYIRQTRTDTKQETTVFILLLTMKSLQKTNLADVHVVPTQYHQVQGKA